MAKSVELEKPKPGVDHVGAFPREYDTDALPERRTAAFARMMAIVSVVEGCAIISLSFALAALMPLQKVVPMIVTGNDKGNEIIHINPASLASPTVDYVSEIQMRNYIEHRYGMVANLAEQQTYWGAGSVVQLMTMPDEFRHFITQARAEYDRLHTAGLVRKVRIDSVRKLGEHTDPQDHQVFTWQVAYTTTDEPQSGPMQAPVSGESHSWVSTIDMMFEPKNVTYNDRLNNPFGVTVISVNDARVD